MILPRLVLLLASQVSLVNSFSPPIININIPQQQQRCTALQQSSKQSTPLSIDNVNMIEFESKDGIMKEIGFTQNAKPMYDAILQAMPWFIRKLVQNNMNNAIAELMIVEVTEDDMYDIIAKITPESNLQDSLDVLDRHKTVTAAHLVADVKEENIGKDVVNVEGELNAAAAEFFETVTEEETVAAAPTQNLEGELKQPMNKMPSWLSPPSLSTASVDMNIIAGKEIHFKQNSKLMYDKILDGHTALFFVRRVVKNNLDKVISDYMMMGSNNDGDGDNDVVVMMESDMYEVIHKASPRILLKFNMAIMDEHKSCS